MIGGAALTVLLVLAIIWWGFLKNKTAAPSSTASAPAAATPSSRLQIDFSVLKSDAVTNLKALPQIPTFNATSSGRSNPFVPYQ